VREKVAGCDEGRVGERVEGGEVDNGKGLGNVSRNGGRGKKRRKGWEGKRIGEKLADWWSRGGPFEDGALC